MTQLDELKRGLEVRGVEYREHVRYKRYGVRVRVVVWKGKDGRVNEAEQAGYSTVMRVSTNDIMSAEEAIATTIGDGIPSDEPTGTDS
jgi:hypothetical protein